jgi:uncharacterized RDD family membrane protein YckC
MNRKITRDYEMDEKTPFLHNPSKHTIHGELATPQYRLIAFILDFVVATLGLGIIWLIWFITLADKGTTPGHYLMGQVIVDSKTGETFGWKKMLVRELLVKGLFQWLLSGLMFYSNYIIDGAFMLTSSQRTLHDRVVGSQVIQRTDKTIISRLKGGEVDRWLEK